MNAIKHWINGRYVPTTDRRAPVTHPATGKVTAGVALATEDEANPTRRGHVRFSGLAGAGIVDDGMARI